jgi:hypothetical protein
MNTGNKENNAQQDFVAYLKAKLEEIAVREYLRGLEEGKRLAAIRTK